MDATLLSLIPRVLVDHLAADPRPLAEPRSCPLNAAAIFVDISGFTALTEQLARKGPSGIEELTVTLNRHFGALIDTIDAHGGDIFKFAGDALLALWPSDQADLSEAACRAAQCALAAQQVFADLALAGNLPLRIRISVGAGPVTVMITGGINNRWEAVATGTALAQLGGAVHLAKPDDVMLSPEVVRILGQSFSGIPQEGGNALLQALHNTTLAPAPRPPETAGDIPFLEYLAPPRLLSYIRQDRADWIGEVRRVTVIFVHFPGLTPETPLDRAQRVTLVLQNVLSRYEASLNKLSVDDKGAAMVAVLGLPTMSHEDDPARGVLAALEIRDQLTALSVRHSIGITTGPAFCGVVGNNIRREYTVIGDVVNLAARLMQKGVNDILCCGRTHEAAASRAEFEALPAVAFKGKEAMVPIFRPSALMDSAPETRRDEAPLAGRQAELALLSGAIRTLAETGENRLIIIEGPAGIGKSRLADAASSQTRAASLRVLRGQGTSVDSGTPYFPWRAIFADILGLQSHARSDTKRAGLEARLTSLAGAQWASRFPLINAVFPGAFPESDATARLAGPALLRQTHELLLRLLPPEPAVLILEDVQWLDSASWALALQISRQVNSLLLIFTARPGVETEEEFQPFSNDSRETIALGPLQSEAALQVVAHRLGVASVPLSVAEMILSKAEGNPLFCQELAGTLQEAGTIVVTNGTCEVTDSAADPGKSDIPETLHAAFTSRIDRLPASWQIALKSASSIGLVFPLALLRHVYPIAAEKPQVGEMVNALVRMEILAPRTSANDDNLGGGAFYEFRNPVFHSVAYSLMIAKQRRYLHSHIGEWIEGRNRDDLSSVRHLLAWHWGKVVEAGEATPETILKTADHHQKAGEQALRRYANREGLLLMDQALRLLAALPPGRDRDQRELTIQSQRGGALVATRGFAAVETERAFSRAWEICLTMDSAPEKFWVMAGLWKFFIGAAMFHRGRELAHELLTTAGADPSLAVVAHRAVGESAFWIADFDTAREHLERAGTLYRPEHHQTAAVRTGQDPAVSALGFLSWTLWLQGLTDRSLEAGNEALALAGRLGHPNTVATATIQQATHFLFRREKEKSRVLVESLIALTKREGFQAWSAGAMIMHGWILADEGQYTEGIGQMSEFLGKWKATGTKSFVPYYTSLLADGYLKSGQPESALKTIDDAIAISEATGEAWWSPELHRLKGEILLAIPETENDTAAACFTHAVDIAKQQGSPSLETRALFSCPRKSSPGTRAL